jgi:hypothetical protein
MLFQNMTKTATACVALVVAVVSILTYVDGECANGKLNLSAFNY